MRAPIRIIGLIILLCTTWAHAAPAPIPFTIDVPKDCQATSWPLAVGVPFPQGTRQEKDPLTVATAAGQAVPTQVQITSRWRDGSVRWALLHFDANLKEKYQIAAAESAAPAQSILIETVDKAVVVTCGGAAYRFTRGQGCFDQVTFQGKPLIQSAGGAFYVIDSQGRRGVFRGKIMTIEEFGPLHAVVRIKGEYLTADNQRNAAGSVYFHFFAGRPGVKISHKLVVSEETLDLWFRDIGALFPLAPTDTATVSTLLPNAQGSGPQSVKLQPGETATLAQISYPHFGHTESQAELRAANKVLAQGPLASDWLDLTQKDAGLAVQLPGFAQQFPKAFNASTDKLEIKLWAGAETNQELNFNSAAVIRDYFGNDWIPADHELTKQPSSGRCTAKTHDFWLYPHAGPLTEAVSQQFAATADEIFTAVDPQWLADSGALDRFHPYDPQRFGPVENVMEDFYHRHITVPELIFPNTGYLSWGRNPYTANAWKIKDGRWYPDLHRLSRILEYNLKRAVWVSYFRSGNRLYRQYARRYTRFLGDFAISNWDTGLKPLGWYLSGQHWHSPAFWGAYDEAVIRKDEKTPFISELANLGYGTSEDVIQFVYDWFTTGDYHSRDAARLYHDGFMKEMNSDVEKALTAVPSYVILRSMGSAYEIDGDPAIYDYGHRFLQRIIGDGADVVNPKQGQNYVKSGEIWAGFYHYYTSTGDELAAQPLYRAAERYYRTNRIELVYRGSGMPQAFSMQFAKTKDPAYLAYLRQAINDFVEQTPTLKDRGVDMTKVDQKFDKPWGHEGAITTVSPLLIGVPVALRVLAENPSATPRVPLVIRPTTHQRTHLILQRQPNESARVDLYIDNFGDQTVVPRVTTLAGQEVPSRIVAQEAHRVDKPHGDINWQHMFNSFNGTYGQHLFFQLEIPPTSKEASGGTSGGGEILRIDSGDQTICTVLYSNLNRIQQVAPAGVVLLRGRKYFVRVPGASETVELFAHRPIRIWDAQDHEIKPESLGAGRYRFPAQSDSVWRIETANDSFVYDPLVKVDTFVKSANGPLLVAMDEPQRSFAVPTLPADMQPPTFTPPQLTKDTPTPVGGKFGQAMGFAPGTVASIPVPAAQRPHERGTLEFWYCPLWSASDLHMEKPEFSELHQDLIKIDPIQITHRVSAEARTGNYNTSHLSVQLALQKGSVDYPVQLAPRAGQWYHIAVTWNVDGQHSDIEVFINGFRQCYYTYRAGVPADLSGAQLAAPAPDAPLQIGPGVKYGKFQIPGNLFDDLRLSRSIRYTSDFTPPKAPLAYDADTHLLIPFDGNLEARTNP